MEYKRKKHRGFFSIDAAFAVLMAVLSFSTFTLIERSASSFASDGAQEISGTNLALRFSSYILNEAGAVQGEGAAGTAIYAKPGELDLTRISAIDLQAIIARSNRTYASISVQGSAEAGADELLHAEAGERQQENYCVKRLALVSREPVLMEVCIS